jgi:hypothetical protein
MDATLSGGRSLLVLDLTRLVLACGRYVAHAVTPVLEDLEGRESTVLTLLRCGEQHQLGFGSLRVEELLEGSLLALQIS